MDQNLLMGKDENVYKVKAGIRNQNINTLFFVEHIKSEHCQNCLLVKVLQLGSKWLDMYFRKQQYKMQDEQ